MEQFDAAARATAEAQQVPFIDFAPAVPSTARYFTDDVHLKAEGNAILARTFADWVGKRYVAGR